MGESFAVPYSPIRFLTLIPLLFCAACTGLKTRGDVAVLNNAAAVGSPFAQRLAEEYRHLANSIGGTVLDGGDGQYLARKGLAAADGVIVMPEVPEGAWLADEDMMELAAARALLVEYLSQGGRERAPNTAASAQARFDCWVMQAKQPGNDTPSCRRTFSVAMQSLKLAVTEAPLGPLPSPPLPPATSISAPAATPEAAAAFMIFFDRGRSHLTSAAQDVIDAVVQEAQNRHPLHRVSVIGHSDSVGSAAANLKTSLARARAVRDALIARGIPADRIALNGKGETQALVPSPDNRAEAANRRVEIVIE